MPIAADGIGDSLSFHLRQKNIAVLTVQHLPGAVIILVGIGWICTVRRVIDGAAIFLGEPHLLCTGIGTRVKIRYRCLHVVFLQHRDIDRYIQHQALFIFKAIGIILFRHIDLIVILPLDLKGSLIRIPHTCVRCCNVSKHLESLFSFDHRIVGSFIRRYGVPVHITLDLFRFNGGCARAYTLYNYINRFRQCVSDIFKTGPVWEFLIIRPVDRQDLCLRHCPCKAGRDALESNQSVGYTHDDRNQSAGLKYCFLPVHINLHIIVKNISVAGNQREFRRV